MKNALYFILGAVCMFTSISLAQTSIGLVDNLTQQDVLQEDSIKYAQTLSSITTPEQVIQLQEEYKNHKEEMKILTEQNEWLIRIYEKISH